MKSIGLVLGIQGARMWQCSSPERKYLISSDLRYIGQMNIPLSVTKSHVIPPYHVAFIEVRTPDTLTCHT